jgi:hypothetical protein
MEEGTELAVETESKFNHQTIETYATEGEEEEPSSASATATL